MTDYSVIIDDPSKDVNPFGNILVHVFKNGSSQLKKAPAHPGADKQGLISTGALDLVFYRMTGR
jgi:hypothetical protein